MVLGDLFIDGVLVGMVSAVGNIPTRIDGPDVVVDNNGLIITEPDWTAEIYVKRLDGTRSMITAKRVECDDRYIGSGPFRYSVESKDILKEEPL